MMLPSCVACRSSGRFRGHVAAFPARQAEVIAQRRPGQVAAVTSARLQRRNHVSTKSSSPSACTGKPRMKPSAAPSSTQRISSSAICSPVPMNWVSGVADFQRDLAQRQARARFASALMRSVVERKLFLPMSPSSGNGASSGYCAEVVMVEEAARGRPAHRRWSAGRGSRGTSPRPLPSCAPTIGPMPGKIFTSVRPSGPAPRALALHLPRERLRFLERRRMGEHRVGVFAGKPDPGIRRAGLEDHRLALRRALDIQRPRDLEEPALVIQRVQLVAVEEPAARAVARRMRRRPSYPTGPAPPPDIRRRSRSAARGRDAGAAVVPRRTLRAATSRRSIPLGRR